MARAVACGGRWGGGAGILERLAGKVVPDCGRAAESQGGPPVSSPKTSNEPLRPEGQRAGLGGQGAAGGASAEEIRSFLARPVAAEDEATRSLVILRDVALVSGLLTLWGAAETWAAVSGLALAALVSTVNGFLVGAATGAVLHEWGHFAGARLGGGHAPLKPIGGLFPLFDFDYPNNDRRSFEWMSIGGNIAHGSVVLLYFLTLPLGSLGAAALVAGALGFAVFSSAIEIPVIRGSKRGLSCFDALGPIPRDFVRRYLPLGIGSAGVAFMLL